MKRKADNIPIEILTRDYLELNSAYRVAELHDTSATAVKRRLKEVGVLRTQNEAARIRNKSNPHQADCLHNENVYQKISDSMQERSKRLGLIRRPRDFKRSKIVRLRNFVYNRDQYTCQHCGETQTYLNAHHLIPFWVKPDAFLDTDNLITLCKSCHHEYGHLNNWKLFNPELIPDALLIRYSLNRERLNDLATFTKRGCDSLNSDNIKNQREESEEVLPISVK
jgi:5-methylcytosine-specific restriction endonuclease McrA